MRRSTEAAVVLFVSFSELEKQLALNLKAAGFGILWRHRVELGAIVGKVHRGAHTRLIQPVSFFSEPSFAEQLPPNSRSEA